MSIMVYGSPNAWNAPAKVGKEKPRSLSPKSCGSFFSNSLALVSTSFSCDTPPKSNMSPKKGLFQ